MRIAKLIGVIMAGMSLAAPAMTGARPPRGPFDPERWPPSINRAKEVHFVSVDGWFKPPGPNWSSNLQVLTGGDQVTEPVTIGGHTGVRVVGIKFNNADDRYSVWAQEHSIDILMLVYGDEALLQPDGSPRYFNFLTGTLPEPIAVDGGRIEPAAVNHRWNWVLFRIPNGLRHMDGGRLVGTIHPRARLSPEIEAVSHLSGQNGGTIRMDGLHDLKVRLVAFGQKGAFGEPDQVNRYVPALKQP